MHALLTDAVLLLVHILARCLRLCCKEATHLVGKAVKTEQQPVNDMKVLHK